MASIATQTVQTPNMQERAESNDACQWGLELIL